MGCGAGVLSNVQAGVDCSTEEELQAACAILPKETRARLMGALESVAKAAAVDFSDLCVGGGCTIEKTEWRAITLEQLGALISHIRRRCELEVWVSCNPKNPVKLTPDTVNLYDAVHFVVSPATECRRCSYVELVADEVQKPNWFVSHWWGEVIVDFIKCLTEHSLRRGLDSRTGTFHRKDKQSGHYWVCAYANNQWDLGSDVTLDPAHSSFFKAIELSEGVLQVIDREAVTYSRIWCRFENFVALTTFSDKLYDMSTAVEWHDRHDIVVADHHASVLCDHRGDHNSSEANPPHGRGKGMATQDYTRIAQAAFPHRLAAMAMTCKLTDAQSSVEADRRSILNSICGHELSSEPPSEHEKFDQLDARLRGRFAASTWSKASSSKGDWGFAEYPKAVNESSIQSLMIQLGSQETSSNKMSDGEISALGRAIPETLWQFKLELARCVQWKIADIATLSEGISRAVDLQEFVIRFIQGDPLSDEAVKLLSQGISRAVNLKTCSFDLDRAPLSDAALQDLAKHLPQKVEDLLLTSIGTRYTDAGLTALGSRIPATLKSMRVCLRGNATFTGKGLIALANALPLGMTKLTVMVDDNLQGHWDKAVKAHFARVPPSYGY